MTTGSTPQGLGRAMGLAALLLCSGIGYRMAIAAERPSLPTGPIPLDLECPQEMLTGKDGNRTLVATRYRGSPFKMRGALWTLLGEPVLKVEFNPPHLSELTFAADGGYANRVIIQSVGDNHGQGYVSAAYGDGLVNIYVSDDVLDRIEYVDFTFSIGTHALDPLPDAFYTKANEEDKYSISAGNYAYIHRRNPGVLGRPGQWGWDVPGSPDWGNFLSPFDLPLRADEYTLPEDHRMSKRKAREAWRRMLWRYHVKKDPLFVNDWFNVQNLRLNTSGLLAYIYKKNPEAYAKLVEREQSVAKRDGQMVTLMAGLTRAGDENRDALGTLVTTADVVRRLNLIDKAFAAFADDISPGVKADWASLRQTFVDAYYRGQLGDMRDALIDASGNGQALDEDLKARIEHLRREADGEVSPGLMARIRDVERMANAKPIIFTSHQDGERVSARVIELKGRADMAAGDTLTLRFNGAEHRTPVDSDGRFAAKIVMKSGNNRIEACYAGTCAPLQLEADIPELALMATLTWSGGGDLDLHVETPAGGHCYYSEKSTSSCKLDIDDQGGRNPENMSIPQDARHGTYKFWVLNFSGGRGSTADLEIYRQGELVESRHFDVDVSDGRTAQQVEVEY